MVLVAASVSHSAVPPVVSYQGQILDSIGTPVPDGYYSFTFSIYDAPVGGFSLWTEAQDSVFVKDGFFSTLLGTITPLTDSVFGGANRYLQVALDGVVQSPRAQLTSVAYSLRVGTVDGSTGGTVFGSMTIETEPNGSNDRPSAVVLGGSTSGGGIGIYEPVDNRANGANVVLKKILEINSNGLIFYGDTEDDTTLFFELDGDITGLGQITMGQNSSSGDSTTVLGYSNTASGIGSTIGGGSQNSNSGYYGTIGGGYNNEVTGDFATIPGGTDNLGGGNYSQAAGRRAKAINGGTFVWADQTDEDFESTGDNQFLIRAGGGVGINTNNPQGALDVAGPAEDGTVNLPASSISAIETADEPGIAFKKNVGSLQLNQKAEEMQELTSVTITTPGAGYIIVRGGAYLRSIYTDRRNQAYLQIDDQPGGALIPGNYTVAGSGEAPSPNGEVFSSMSMEVVYVKDAGTYTFYLEALAHPDNGLAARTYMNDPYLSALFVATSYGGSPEPARGLQEVGKETSPR